jgi:uncharacterized membrane protein HdeD (DUF308 family)
MVTTIDLPTAKTTDERAGGHRIYPWRWWTVVLRGLAAIALGVISVIAPGITFVSLVIVFGIYAIVDGALALSLGWRFPSAMRGAMIGRGIVSIVAGILALVLPQVTALALLFVVAAWAIVSGILEIVMAIQMRKQISGEWLLALEGALSIAFGVLLFLAPLAGAIVIGLWIGAYALVLGGMLVANGLRMRSLQKHPQPALMPA